MTYNMPFVTAITELLAYVICISTLLFVSFACAESKTTYDRTMVALTNGPPAPSLEISDEFINNFVEGKIEDGLREKYGHGFSD